MKFIYTITALIILSACGFTPVHGTKSVNEQLSQIEITTQSSRQRQIIKNHLIDTLYKNGKPLNPAYKLQISPVIEQTVTIGLDADDEISRTQLRLNTDIHLVNNDNKIVLRHTVRATTAYNILAGQFTTYITEKNARENALKTLAQNIKTQLEIYFSK